MKKNNFNQVTRVGYVKNSLIMMTKKLEIIVTIIFHNLRGYDSHLIFCELNKFDVKSDVIPNRLEKYMTFF